MKSDTDSPLQVQKLFLQHATPLRGFILGLLPDRAAAEDIFQEVFMTVTQRAADFDAKRSFLKWARGIARIKVLEYHRLKGSRPLLFDGELLETMVETAAEADDDAWVDRRAALTRCIEQLAPRARQILELRYAEMPLSATMIAQRLAWTASAVNVALTRARRFLEECTDRALQRRDAL